MPKLSWKSTAGEQLLRRYSAHASTRDTVITTLKIATDVREKLQEWAQYNLSSMTAELNRSVRERAEREKREKAVG